MSDLVEMMEEYEPPMPKSRNRSKRKTNPPQPKAQTETPLQIKKRHLPKWVTATARAVSFAASVFGLYVGYELYLDTIPEIHVGNSDESSPLAFPFKISNRSTIFSISGMAVLCAVKSLSTKSGSGMRDFTIVGPASGPISLVPRGFANSSCNIGSGQMMQFAPNDPVLVAHIFVRLVYFTGGFHGWKRVTDPVEFNWYTNTSHPRWIEGPLAR